MSDDKRLAIMASRTAELQTMLQGHIDALNYGRIGIAEMFDALTEDYNEIKSRYSAILDSTPEEICKS